MKKLILLLIIAIAAPLSTDVFLSQAQVYMGVEGENGYMEINPVTGRAHFMITNDYPGRRHHRHHRHKYHRYHNGYRCSHCGAYYPSKKHYKHHKKQYKKYKKHHKKHRRHHDD